MNRVPADNRADDRNVFDLVGLFVVWVFGQNDEVGQFSGRDRSLNFSSNEAYAPLIVQTRRASATLIRWLGPHIRPSKSLRVTML